MAKLHRVEVTIHGPEGLIDRVQTVATTSEIAASTMGEMKKLIEKTDKATDAAEKKAEADNSGK